MQTTLCFDFGNTRLKCAVFNGADLKEVIVLENDDASTILAIVQQHNATKSILSSVINHNPAIEKILASNTKFHKLNHTSKLPIK